MEWEDSEQEGASGLPSVERKECSAREAGDVQGLQLQGAGLCLSLAL